MVRPTPLHLYLDSPYVTFQVVDSHPYAYILIRAHPTEVLIYTLQGIVFNPSQKGLAYLRTDIGGAYKLNSDDTWTPITDFVDNTNWHDWGIDALATDPVNPNNLYLAVGEYTNSWDPSNGSILKSTDQGNTFTSVSLPFKVGGNMPGRGMGERLVVDPNNNSILYFGARSGHGLWKSTNAGASWTQVTAFPDAGTYVPDSSGLWISCRLLWWLT